MRAVEKLAADRRFHEITLDEVAAAANVGKGTIYHYFEDKDDLFFQAATAGFDELCQLLQQTVPNNTSFALKLSNMCRQVSQFFAIRCQLLQMIQSQAARLSRLKSEIRQRWILKQKKLVDTVSDILSEGVAEGIIRSDISTEVLAIFLLGMLRTGAGDLNGSSEVVQKNTLLADLFLNGACQPEGKTLTLRNNIKIT